VYLPVAIVNMRDDLVPIVNVTDDRREVVARAHDRDGSTVTRAQVPRGGAFEVTICDLKKRRDGRYAPYAVTGIAIMRVFFDR
jgi:hypothetical protein